MSAPPAKTRVVVTGFGSVTAHGEGVETFWQALLAGQSAISRVERFNISDYPCQVGAEIKSFDVTKYMDAKEARRNDRYTHYAVAAAKLAVEHAKLDVTQLERNRFGVLVGSGIGGMETIENQVRILAERGPRKVSPFFIPALISNMASGVVAIAHGARGPNFGVVSACSSATHAIGESLRMLRAGDADIMLTGGSEAPMTPAGYAGFCSMKAMSTDFNDRPTEASRPFDALRDGFVMGEGAGILVLETLEHARQRGATILAELVGYGASCDAYHITSPDPEGAGLAYAVEFALRDGNVAPTDVGYINAHGTSTPYNDKFETKAFKSVFGDHAYRTQISSTKSMTGHLLGAAGAIEAIVSIQVLRTGDVPPTINLVNPDPDCDLDYTPNVRGRTQATVALTTNLGFGGHNAALVLRQWSEG